MNRPSSPEEVRHILEIDRVWSAYALADLDPSFRHLSQWFAENGAAIMIYHGIAPPVLFATGRPLSLRIMLSQVPAGRYSYTLPSYARVMLRWRMRVEHESRMWRMNLLAEQFNTPTTDKTVKLGPSDLDKINALFDDHPDRPDAFAPEQLETGTFYGVEDDDRQLISISGTHIVSDWASVAAMGNVFTRPDRRGEGWARRTSAAVIADLLARDIKTIVLNVEVSNQPALTCYRKLGFWPHCAYVEGIMELWPEQQRLFWRDQ